MIEDWELGVLYWNSLRQCSGDEKEANRLVKQKYFYKIVPQSMTFIYFLGLP